MNCQCPKPDYIAVEKMVHPDTTISGYDLRIDAIVLTEPFLHGKKGTRACCKCHQLLCLDCLTIIVHDDDGLSWYYCQACKEDLK